MTCSIYGYYLPRPREYFLFYQRVFNIHSENILVWQKIAESREKLKTFNHMHRSFCELHNSWVTSEKITQPRYPSLRHVMSASLSVGAHARAIALAALQVKVV